MYLFLKLEYNSHRKLTVFSVAKEEDEHRTQKFSVQTRPTSKTTAKDLLLKIEAEECRRSLKKFVQCAWNLIEPVPFVDGRPIDAMVEHLEAVTRGEITRLIINIPPRHTKSTLVSVLWPVWVWLQHPEERFLCASYSLDLSTRDNLRKRRIIEDPWFQARFSHLFQLTSDQHAKRHFENNYSGYQMSISVDGGTTGQGGSYLLLDDPHNASEAYSQVERTKAVIWFREVWTNRLNNQVTGRMVTIGQRIHDEDVCGYIIKERPDWVHLNLPAYFEKSSRCVTPIWRDDRKKEGEVLWPERFSKNILEGLRRDLGSLGFAAQYQQRPIPLGGNQFKKQWFKYYTENSDFYLVEDGNIVRSIPKKNCKILITVDLAISTKQSADFTVFSVWATTKEKECILLDCVREHMDNPTQQRQAHVLYQKYHPIYIHIENVAYQLALIQQLLKDGLPVKEYKPVKDKVARASTASVFYEAGRMYHPKGVVWINPLEDELNLFPMGKNDDFVDTVSMICDSLTSLSLDAEEHIKALQRRARIAQQRGISIVQPSSNVQEAIEDVVRHIHSKGA
jgi:predicted phage terminase large subunit-like protein